MSKKIKMKKIVAFMLALSIVSAPIMDSDFKSIIAPAVEISAETLNSVPVEIYSSYGSHYTGYFQTDDNQHMAYRIAADDEGNILGTNIYDVAGKVGDAWKQVTYGGEGFKASVWNSDGTAKDNVTITCTPEFIADGQAIRFTYKLTNSTADSIDNFKFFVAADTMIAGEDASTNTLDDSSTPEVIKMTSGDVALFGLSLTEGAHIIPTAYDDDDFSTEIQNKYDYYYRSARSYYGVVYDDANPAEVLFADTTTDSAFVAHFPETSLAAGGSIEYTFVVGMGDNDSIDSIIAQVKNALNSSVNYAYERLTDLEADSTYTVEVLDENGQGNGITYTIKAIHHTSDGDDIGSIPLVGYDTNGEYYDLIGKKIRITKQDGTDSESQEVDIAGRPAPNEPGALQNEPTDINVVTDVKTTNNSITIKASTTKDGLKQQYAVVKQGESIENLQWKDENSDGNVIFDKLSAETKYVIYTRVPATNSKPASEMSKGVTVITKGMFTVTKTDSSIPWDGEDHTVDAISVTGATGFEIRYSETLDGLKDEAKADEYTTDRTEIKFSEVGEHEVYYRVSGKGYYNAYGVINFTINKVDTKITVRPNASSITYGQKLSDSILTGGSATDYNGTIVEGNFEWVAPDTKPKVSDSVDTPYNVIFIPNDTDHYNKTGTSVYYISITVKKADINVTEPAAKTITYSGAANELITAGSVSAGATMMYSLDGTDWSPAIPTASDVGTYNVYYKVEQSDLYNYNSLDAKYTNGTSYVTSTIKRKSTAVSTPDAMLLVSPKAVSNLTYNGKAQTLTTKGTVHGGTLMYSINGGEWQDTLPTAINAGKYTIEYYVKGNAGYNDTDIETLTVSIAKAIPTIDEPTADGEYTYGVTLKDVALSGDWNWIIPAQKPVVNNSGYKAYIEVDDTNYDYSNISGYYSSSSRVVRTVAVTINKAVPEVSVIAESKQYLAGDTFTIENTVVSSDTAGEITFNDVVLKAGTNTISWTFVPEDENFAEVTGKIQVSADVTVKSTLSNITFTGENTAGTAEAYTATLKPDTGYSLPEEITVSMGGKTLTAGTGYTYDSKTGKVVISKVTGDIVISANAVKDVYDYVVNIEDIENITVTGDNTANSEEAYTATLKADTGYSLPEEIVVTMGGKELVSGTDYTYDSTTGKVVISKVTGDIVISANAVKDVYDYVVNIEDIENIAVTGDNTANSEKSYTATLKADTGYSLPEEIVVTMGGKTLTAGAGYTYDSTTGEIVIAKVTGDISISANAVKDVYDYIVNINDIENITVTGDNTANSEEAYTATLKADTGYSLPEEITVTMGGKELVSGTDYTYDSTTGEMVISKVTGDISISANAVKNEDGFLLGDANVDKKVSAVDIVYLKNHLLEIKPLEGQGFINADMNQDGKLAVVDLVLLKKYILGL